MGPLLLILLQIWSLLLIWQVTNDDALLTWWILKFKQEDPITGSRVLCLDSEGEWDMVQLAHSSSALVTSNTRHLGLFDLLRSNDVHIVGKGLSHDRTQFGTQFAHILNDTASPNWHEVTELLPLWRNDCSCDILSHFLLGTQYGWKQVINHATFALPYLCLTFATLHCGLFTIHHSLLTAHFALAHRQSFSADSRAIPLGDGDKYFVSCVMVFAGAMPTWRHICGAQAL